MDGERLKTNEEKCQAVLGRFIQQGYQNNLDERKYILSDLNSTLAESDPYDETTEDEFNEGLRRRSGKYTAPGPDTVRYSVIKNLTEDRTALCMLSTKKALTKATSPKTGHSFLKHMQLHLDTMCMKDSRGKNNRWLWQSSSRTHTTGSSSSC